ncbi:hypothetical protein [Micromonospora sp. NPDC093277]|uniref:hypothetical protein n=1 Tax=Micromonospora sp. NPDC093277 TaxID=3364291 RepID=UPI0038255FCF
MRKLSSIAAAVTLTVGCTGVAVTSVAAPASASCNHSHTNYDSKSGSLFNGSNINIRTGPHTSCPSLGFGQANHNVDFWCYTPGDGVTANGYTTHSWTYLRDTTTGVSGWVADALLKNLGSLQAC